MNVRCAGCSKQAQVDPVVTSDAWPIGWQIVLNRDGERWFCSHTCAARWHETRSGFESPSAFPVTRRAPAPGPSLDDLLRAPSGRVC